MKHRARSGQQDEFVGVRLPTRIDASTGNAVLQQLMSALSQSSGRTLLVDISGVDAVGHAGVEVLETARRQARVNGGDLHLTGVSEALRPLLGHFPLHGDRGRSFGVTEELLVVDPSSGEPLALADRMLGVAGYPPNMAADVTLEQIGVRTAPYRDHESLLGGILAGRRLADSAARECGARVAALGTSPLGSAGTLSPGPRSARLAEEFGITVREQLTCALHVHVGIESPEEGVAVLDRIRDWLPLCVALSANSPYSRGADTGYASFRTQAWNRWPTSGPQDVYGSIAAYQARVAAMVRTGVAVEEGMASFDARLSRADPTVEVRVADVPLVASDSALIAVLVRALVETAAREARDGVPPLGSPAPLLRLASWRASRSGLRDQLVHPVRGVAVSARVAAAALLDHLAPVLAEGRELVMVEDSMWTLLKRGTGEVAQREAGSGLAGLRGVVSMAVESTLECDLADGGQATASSEVMLEVLRTATPAQRPVG